MVLLFPSLPIEINDRILHYLSFHEMSQCRQASKHFKQVFDDKLNNEWIKAQHYAANIDEKFRKLLPRRPSVRSTHPFYNLFMMKNSINMILNRLSESFNEPIAQKKCCFYAGKLLDVIFSELNYINQRIAMNDPGVVMQNFLHNIQDYEFLALENFKSLYPITKQDESVSIDLLSYLYGVLSAEVAMVGAIIIGRSIAKFLKK
ncbi:F-box only protein 28 [Ditylenchus destructor]|nr:F-box only protein 28 [Ditylenchus destructor]